MNKNETINELIDLVSKAQNYDIKKELLKQLDREKDKNSSQDDCSGFWFGDIEGTWGRF
jgi:cell division FtsZ-interacting protein ZapD